MISFALNGRLAKAHIPFETEGIPASQSTDPNTNLPCPLCPSNKIEFVEAYYV